MPKKRPVYDTKKKNKKQQQKTGTNISLPPLFTRLILVFPLGFPFSYLIFIYYFFLQRVKRVQRENQRVKK